MKKLTGIVSEDPRVEVKEEEKEVEVVFDFAQRHSNAIAPLRKPKPDVKSKIRRLLIGTVLVTFLLSLAVFGLVKFIGGQPSLTDNIEWISVEVQSGETLWSLVQMHQKKGVHYNVQELVYIAKKEHNGSVSLHTGELIKIPVVKK